VSVDKPGQNRSPAKIDHLRFGPALRLQNRAVRSSGDDLRALHRNRLLDRKSLVYCNNFPIPEYQIGIGGCE
jgi:hypothetical protein